MGDIPSTSCAYSGRTVNHVRCSTASGVTSIPKAVPSTLSAPCIEQASESWVGVGNPSLGSLRAITEPASAPVSLNRFGLSLLFLPL